MIIQSSCCCVSKSLDIIAVNHSYKIYRLMAACGIKNRNSISCGLELFDECQFTQILCPGLDSGIDR